MFRFVTRVHENFRKTFPKFDHHLHASNHDTMTNFMIFWIHLLVNGILKTIRSTSSEHGLWARFSKSTSISCLRHQIILYYSKHFQFNPKNSINEIKWQNIAKIMRNIPDFNKEYNTLYVYQKKLGVLNQYLLAQVCRVPRFCRVQNGRHTAKKNSLACAKSLSCASVCSTRQMHTFAVCWTFAVCIFSWHTTNKRFAMCQTFAVCCFYWHTTEVRSVPVF